MTNPWRWRDHIKCHPASELFPLMAPDELQALAEDIKQHGLQTRPVFFKDEHGVRLLDGRNRLDAAELAGKFPASHVVNGGPLQRLLGWDNAEDWDDTGGAGNFDITVRDPPEDPVELVVSHNIRRRHLSAEQKRDVIAKLLKAKPKWSDREIAKQTGVSHTTVASVRNEANGQSGHKPTERVEVSGRRARGVKPGTPRRSKEEEALLRNSERLAAEQRHRAEPPPPVPPVEPAPSKIQRPTSHVERVLEIYTASLVDLEAKEKFAAVEPIVADTPATDWEQLYRDLEAETAMLRGQIAGMEKTIAAQVENLDLLPDQTRVKYPKLQRPEAELLEIQVKLEKLIALVNDGNLSERTLDLFHERAMEVRDAVGKLIAITSPSA